MEILSLDSNFQPKALIENYTSCVWTERYNSAGDFEIVSSDIEGIMAALPLESFVTLRESTVPMVAEVYKLSKDMNAAPTLTITGRTLETALERRASVSTLAPAAGRAVWTVTAASPSDAAYKTMRVVLGDVIRTRTDDSLPLSAEVSMGATVLTALSPAISAKDAIPQMNLILPKDYSTLTPNSYEIESSDLYSTVMNLIAINHHGIKATRPDPVSAPGKTTVDIEIYNGGDLTSLVTFDARFDQFDSSTYLLSSQASTNVGYVYGSNGSDQVLKNTVDATHPEPEGLSRRVLLVDGNGDSTLNTSAIRTSRGIAELYQHNVTAIFDGEVAAQVALGYNNSYFLGDLLMLVGEYGLTTTVRVSEFIRSSDSSGEKAFPAFEAVE
jgi:hypothetical protein